MSTAEKQCTLSEEEEKKQTLRKNIIENYKNLEESIVKQLALHYDYHGLVTGTGREDIWLQLFELIIPKKFVIEHSVFIIDSQGRISKEVDLAIIDNTYTPYIFQFGRLKFVPIEAVAAVVECKSKTVDVSEDQKNALDLWCESIKVLNTSRDSIARMATGTMVKGALPGKDPKVTPSTQTSTRPIRIFCGYSTNVTKEKLAKIKELFDFVLIAAGNKNQRGIQVTVKQNTLQEWYKELNHYENNNTATINDCEELKGSCLEDLTVKEGDEEISLLSFNFQLNQLLMLINNPILFPHLAYAKLFNGIEGEAKD